LPSIGHPPQFEIIKVETFFVGLARGIESDCFEWLRCAEPGDELNSAIRMNFLRRLSLPATSGRGSFPVQFAQPRKIAVVELNSPATVPIKRGL
jgi:hypothetical protein